MTDAPHDTSPPPEDESPTAPDWAWALAPFRQFLDYVKELTRLVEMSSRGIVALTGIPYLAQSVVERGATDIEEVRSLLTMGREQADFAQREADNDFPLLHAQALVSLWGGLESLIRFFLVEWLKNEPRAMRADDVQKLRVRLGEYEGLDDDEKAWYILDLLEREIKAPYKLGVSRFESLLCIFGLSGQVDPTDGKNLFTLCQLRNVIVHRRGIADRKLVECCPYLSLELGDPALISKADYDKYRGSVISYVDKVLDRIEDFYRLPKSQSDEILSKQEEGMVPNG